MLYFVHVSFLRFRISYVVSLHPPGLLAENLFLEWSREQDGKGEKKSEKLNNHKGKIKVRTGRRNHVGWRSQRVFPTVLEGRLSQRGEQLYWSLFPNL